jgi:D-tyrosyl-tRNA(Tyr) deacylase
MKILLQRVAEASVSIDKKIFSSIESGLLALVCIEKGDDEAQVESFARKVANIRLFTDDDGKINLSILDTGGETLVVSQFTLAANLQKGNRPGFSNSADPEIAERLCDLFCKQLAVEGVPVKVGEFHSHMLVSLVNDGPMTIWMDSNH